ncbi:MAG TPA: sulfite exporter TauE/SafE family protein [Bacteroidetes bacterium]|nr:sulfite exporter TauE/SafE family protein [Bacteroidota bacterium]
MVWTAFIIGLLGSLHCVGMCGPIALALPVRGAKRWAYLWGRVLYNLGRIVTYSIMGGIVAMLGVGAKLFEMQQTFSIIMGALLVLWALGEMGLKWLPRPRLMDRMSAYVRAGLSRRFTNGHPSSLFVIGLLNGLLPCGFVYTGLFLAALTAHPAQGALAMALFGMGTFPVMFFLSFSAKWVTAGLRSRLNRAMPVIMVVFGLLFIIRGMSLGIPYLSPQQKVHADGQVKVHCCTPPPK